MGAWRLARGDWQPVTGDRASGERAAVGGVLGLAAALERGSTSCLHQLGLGQARAHLQQRLKPQQQAFHLAARGAVHRRVALQEARRFLRQAVNDQLARHRPEVGLPHGKARGRAKREVGPEATGSG